jgi:hypothetical protein
VWFTAEAEDREIKAGSATLRAVTLSGKQRDVVRLPGDLRLLDIATSGGRALVARSDFRLGLRVSESGSSSERDLSWLGDDFLGDLSSDGRFIVFTARNALFLRRLDRSASAPVQLGEGYVDPARLSPDGKWVLTAAAASPRQLVLLPTGAGEIRPLEGLPPCHAAEWVPDGRRVLCAAESGASGRPAHLLMLDVQSGKARDVPLPDGARLWWMRVSRDGGRVAIPDVRQGVTVVPLAGGTPTRVPAETAGYTPIGWLDDGRHLLLYRVGEVPERVQRLDIETGKMDFWREVTLEDPAGVMRIHPICVAPDGRSWAYTYTRVLSDLYLVEGLK